VRIYEMAAAKKGFNDYGTLELAHVVQLNSP